MSENISIEEHNEQPVTNEHENVVGEEAHEVKHETTLFAEPIIHFGSFTVTNSLFSAWIVVFIIIVLSVIIKSKIKKIPRGIQNIFEIVLEGALNLADSVTNDRKKTLKLFPVVFALFIFILLNNWLGLLPGVGSIGFIEEDTFIPFFRGGTADLNTTLGLAILGIVFTNILGIITIGAWKHINKFIGIKLIMEIPKKVIKEPTIVLVNPIKAFVGLIEIIGEIAKIASLTFRLFGNIFAGEVLLASMAAIFAYAVPIPFMFLEIIVGIVQALIFAMLILVFGTIAMNDEH
jgi:F-type H+-transporting ATPase subunit a